jgi:hypothetical protein
MSLAPFSEPNVLLSLTPLPRSRYEISFLESLSVKIVFLKDQNKKITQKIIDRRACFGTIDQGCGNIQLLCLKYYDSTLF